MIKVEKYFKTTPDILTLSPKRRNSRENMYKVGSVQNRIKLFNNFERRIISNIQKQSKLGLETEIKSFIEECNIKNEYYSFR